MYSQGDGGKAAGDEACSSQQIYYGGLQCYITPSMRSINQQTTFRASFGGVGQQEQPQKPCKSIHAREGRRDPAHSCYPMGISGGYYPLCHGHY